MRSKTYGINIRVNQTEKKKLQSNAKKCGLSLSAYLRKVGLGKEVNALPDKEFYEIYREVSALRSDIERLDKAWIDAKLEYIEKKILDVYYSKEG